MGGTGLQGNHFRRVVIAVHEEINMIELLKFGRLDRPRTAP
jgi:hypothetical protein